MPPISVAILGAGIFARIAHLPAIRQLDGIYELKAIYSRSKNTASELAKSAEETLAKGNQGGSPIQIYHDQGDPSTNLDALLAREDIQAVIIALPINLQPSIVLKSLAAGKHVISEKPVAPTVKDGIELIKTYEELYKPKGLVWRVAENFEAEPGLRAAGQAIAEQKIGKVCFWNMQVLNNVQTDGMWYKTPWRTVPEYQGGFVLDGGVHSAAALRVALPSPFKELTGFASLNRKHLAPHDTIHAVIRSEDGSHGVLELSWGLPSPPGLDLFRVVGTEGILSISRFNKKNEETGKDEAFYKVEIINAGSGAKEEIVEKSCGVVKELENFANHLAGHDDGLGSPLGALKDVAIIQAGLNSNGSVIDLQNLVKDI
ncbi:NAD(P)-binding protein [Serendipita vermifera]|nr:NAD(P)-binding protein [Serendipita vermifera]